MESVQRGIFLLNCLKDILSPQVESEPSEEPRGCPVLFPRGGRHRALSLSQVHCFIQTPVFLASSPPPPPNFLWFLPLDPDLQQIKLFPKSRPQHIPFPQPRKSFPHSFLHNCGFSSQFKCHLLGGRQPSMPPNPENLNKVP